jgi:hypothetical protein
MNPADCDSHFNQTKQHQNGSCRLPAPLTKSKGFSKEIRARKLGLDSLLPPARLSSFLKWWPRLIKMDFGWYSSCPSAMYHSCKMRLETPSMCIKLEVFVWTNNFQGGSLVVGQSQSLCSKGSLFFLISCYDECRMIWTLNPHKTMCIFRTVDWTLQQLHRSTCGLCFSRVYEDVIAGGISPEKT